MTSSRDIKKPSLTYHWLSKILKSSMDTIWLQKSIWSFTAVDFLDFDFFPVECSQLKVKHPSDGQI